MRLPAQYLGIKESDRDRFPARLKREWPSHASEIFRVATIAASAGCQGVLLASSASHGAAVPSEGARQSPRGESAPPAETLGPLGIAERLN